MNDARAAERRRKLCGRRIGRRGVLIRRQVNVVIQTVIARDKNRFFCGHKFIR